MLIPPKGQFHLTYCTNIHPGESWTEIFKNLKTYVIPIKLRIAGDKAFGIGLRLSDTSARELLKGESLHEFKRWLIENNLYVFTINGFPYGGFHGQTVKEQVYTPDWTTPARRDYTLRLAEILSQILPDNLDEGGISTAPLYYKPRMSDKNLALQRSAIHFIDVVKELISIRKKTGKLIHVDVEPEPDCLPETINEFIRYFRDFLIPQGSRLLTNLTGITIGEAEKYIKQHIQLCYDICHFAVLYEKPSQVIKAMEEAGLSIGKAQISSALKIDFTGNLQQKLEHLKSFEDPVYLHQVVERSDDNTLTHYRDITDALPYFLKTFGKEWRIHYHVPIFIDHYGPLQSTQDHIIEAIDILKKTGFTEFLEIETYTWGVLPPDMRINMIDSIYKEYEWALTNFCGEIQR